MANKQRVDSATRGIDASAEAVFAAFADPRAWEKWLPPAGMTGQVTEFDFREGGRYQMTLTYLDSVGHGKSTEDSDITTGIFTEIVPNKRLVHEVVFESDDPTFAGTMRMAWEIERYNEGVRVTFCATDVPAGISPEDHVLGLQSTLENLTQYVERSV